MVRNPRQLLAERARAEADDRDLCSRTDKQRERKQEADALLTLATDLSTVSERWLRRLPLDEDVAEAVMAARSISSHRARQRQLKAVRRLLKSTDWLALQTQLDRLRQPASLAPNASSAAAKEAALRAHVEALIAGGDAALDELLRAAPTLDRKQLRALLRNARQDNEECRRRARAKLRELLAAVRHLATEATAPSEHSDAR